MSTKDITFNHYVTWGDNFYGTPNFDRHPVILENARLGISETIVGADGRIKNFPGIAHAEVVNEYTTRYALERIHFCSSIENLDGMWALVWQVEPEGRYWEDDYGFGATSRVEVNLYARLDERGHFIEPFHLYEVNDRMVYGTRAEMELVASMADDRKAMAYLRDEIGPMVAEAAAHLADREDAYVTRLLPGTCLEARLHVYQREGSWVVGACVGKRFEYAWANDFSGRKSDEELERYLATDEAVEDALRELEYCYEREAKA